ncbi:hypothetical protein UFOVP313_33 [uncultured Caudovirales phage]|uniref:Uncharacterized protein n=1 Tax=uncultured Caudovirales phage TaxID=2100421 RepID=A0A6J5LVF5_9CAUD|nr:hypothetical protein UFOVP313_33 [uncultured Caudovirales phage]
MADLALLQRALQSAQTNPYQRNPFIGFSQTQPTATSEYGRAAENIIKGLVGGYGFSQANEEVGQNLRALTEARRTGDYNAILGNPDTQDAASVFMLDDADRARQLDLYRQQKNVDNEAAVSRAVAELQLTNPRRFQQLQKMGVFGSPAGAPDMTPETAQVRQPTSPFKTLDDLYEEKVNQRLDMGIPAGEASESAMRALKPTMDMINRQYKDEESTRQAAQKLMDLGQNAMIGTNTAGYQGTGGKVAAGLAKFGSNFFSGLEDNAQGYSMFDKILPELVAARRPPGAFTEQEWEIIRKSGPSASNTEGTNRLMSQNILQAGKLMNDYADLLTTVREMGGDRTTADRLWAIHKSKYPLFTQREDGIIANDIPAPNVMELLPALQGGGQMQLPSAASASSAATKVINGVTYTKVPGGWVPAGQ